jgi:pyruvate dehydrogenase E2 component (dihydrolipoamide acetyltransferase)
VASQEIRVPDFGDIEGAEVVEVLVAVGDTVAVDDSLLTVESDKASMEIPATVAGKIVELKVQVGDQVTSNALVALVEAQDSATGQPETKEAPKPPDAPPAKAEIPTPVAKPAATLAPPPQAAAEPIDDEAFRHAHASPGLRRYARELGVDLAKIQGSGRKGRITQEDVQGYVKRAVATAESGAAVGGGVPPIPAQDFSRFGATEEIPLTRIQKVSLKHLSRAWLNVPHVTQFDEADITELEAFRQAHKDDAKRKGFNLTPVAFLLKACATALQEFPRFNSSLHPDGDKLILKKYIHIGVAVDTEDGLVVPVIRDVDQKGLYQLGADLVAVSGRAREGKLTPADFQGGCFSISSLGGIGGTAFTPIVNAPEVAILGASRNQTRPVWNGSTFEPRLMLPLSLSYDHRVIDGALAARFIVYLSGLLGDIRKLLL